MSHSRLPQIAVIGYGFAGRCFHSYLVQLAPNLVLRGVASRQAATRERIKSERRCIAYESFEAALADPEVDLVVLATPNHAHCDQAIAAMYAGKHVVSDKIMALNLDECDRMIAASRDTGRFLTCFQNRRWDGDYLTLRKAMADGLLGDVKWLEMAWQGFGAWGGWRGTKAAGGGKLYDLGSHLIDQVCMLFPERITGVYARLHHDWPSTDTESHALVVVHFETGRTAVVDTSSLAAISKPRIQAFGTGGSFVKHGLDPQEACMIAGNIDDAVDAPANHARYHNGKNEIVLPPVPGRWRGFYENIGDVLLGKAKPAIQLHEVRRAIGVVDAAFRSAAAGQVIAVDLPALD